MSKQHPNLQVLTQLNLFDLASCSELFDADFVWHYCNPKLPALQGDYHGMVGLQRFFGLLMDHTHGHFKSDVLSAMPMGDELVVVHVQNSLQLNQQSICVDAVVVWRIVDGLIKEAWDIPSAYSVVA